MNGVSYCSSSISPRRSYVISPRRSNRQPSAITPGMLNAMSCTVPLGGADLFHPPSVTCRPMSAQPDPPSVTFRPMSAQPAFAAPSLAPPPTTVAAPKSLLAASYERSQVAGLSCSEGERTSGQAVVGVGEFHDRHWLPREAIGDAAASSSAAHAALSDDPATRSVAAHLYAVRATHRAIGQVIRTVKHRGGLEGGDKTQQREFAAELESAIGAALHSEVCHVLDELSRVHSQLIQLPAASGGFGGGGDSSRDGRPFSTRRFPFLEKRALEAARHAAVEAKQQEQISELKHQVESLQRSLDVAIRDATGRTRT